MRIGGSFPFNQSGSFPVALGPGQYFYIPSGEHLITLGPQSICQWWDPVNSLWRNLGPAPCATFALGADAYNYRIINLSGVVVGGLITTAGTAGTNGIGPTQTGASISFGAAPSGGQAAKGYIIVGGAVGSAGGSATVTQAGSGFVVPPLVLIDPPPIGGIQATAVSTITAGGAINSVTMVNPGAGYTSVPNFYLVPQFLDYPGQLALPYTVPATGLPAPYFAPGLIAGGAGTGGTGGIMPPQNFMRGLQIAAPITSGALITGPALAGSGTTTGIVVTDYGSGYTSVPTITFTNAPTSAAATAVMSWGVTAVTGGSGTGYTVGNLVESTLGKLFVSTTAQTYINNDHVSPRSFRGVLTSTAGALNIEDNGFGFEQALIAGNFGVGQGTTIASGSIVFSAISMGGVNDTSLIQTFIND